MRGSRTRIGELGMSISMVVLAMTMVSMIVLYVGTQTLNSMYTARKKSDNSVGMAAGDSAIEKYRAALQARVADEGNGFIPSRAELERLVLEQPNTRVITSSDAPGYASMGPVRSSIPPAKRVTVEERGTDTIGYWQLYDVLPPRYVHAPPARPATDLVVYIRAWATAKDSTSKSLTTKPRIFRVEYRPGYFSDYQSLTDGPFFVKDNPNYTINGPIHSNGYTTTEWLARDNGGNTRKGIWFENAPTCTDQARFTTSQNAGIRVPGSSCAGAFAARKRNARQISLLGVEPMYRHMNARCGALVVCRSGEGSYDVRLGFSEVFVNGTRYPLLRVSDSGTLAVLVDGDVTLHGSLRMPANVAGRVTIATRRRSASSTQPQVYLRAEPGNRVVGAASAKDTVGVVAQGDIVMIPSGINGSTCMGEINVAAISQAGSVTIPPEYVTIASPAIDPTPLNCPAPTEFTGSFASHGQFLASIKWPDPKTGIMTTPIGYSRPVLSYNRNLFLNPPPFFPTATPWAVTKAKDANTRCLALPPPGDPTCE